MVLCVMAGGKGLTELMKLIELIDTELNKNIQCPWLTKGLLNACKKKNNLYKRGIKKRTKETEQQY